MAALVNYEDDTVSDIVYLLKEMRRDVGDETVLELLSDGWNAIAHSMLKEGTLPDYIDEDIIMYNSRTKTGFN